MQGPTGNGNDAQEDVMYSGEVLALLVLAAIAVIVLIAFLFAQSNRTRSSSVRPTPTPTPRFNLVKTPVGSTRNATSTGSGLEAFFGLLLLGVVGVALYKFIESGGFA